MQHGNHLCNLPVSKSQSEQESPIIQPLIKN